MLETTPIACADLIPAPTGSRACDWSLYLAHVQDRRSIRSLARETGYAPSTVLRRIRKAEARRDDPMVDAALRSQEAGFDGSAACTLETPQMPTHLPRSADPDDTVVDREARRILRRLCESGAVLVVSEGLDRAVVLREVGQARPVRIGVLDRVVAERFALNDWIALKAKGRVKRYVITPAGRAALKRMLAVGDTIRSARRDAAFQQQHIEAGTRKLRDDDGVEQSHVVNLAESPLALLARRKGSDGARFLSDEEVMAGERLRDDFEKAHMGPRLSQNWERFMTAGVRGGTTPTDSIRPGPEAARSRVTAALSALGPGLSDVALRCCCMLEGLEATERRLGWSARSGKVVLKIALGRLAQHYGLTQPPAHRVAG